MARQKRTLLLILAVIAACVIVYLNLLPKKLFHCSYSTVIYSSNGELMGATVSGDGQWRFPKDTLLPDKYIKALLLFEDKNFYYHPGFNPFSLVRAAYNNIKLGHVVSGGSTISMQVIRISRGGKSRTYLEKLYEIVLSTRLELRYSKREILGLYAAHAPFGGNIVGLRAAAWRYFGRNLNDISWAEAATLAVLPNAPSLIHPGRNREMLMQKRNRLLQRLAKKGYLAHNELELSLLEKIPDVPFNMPQMASHLLQRISEQFSNGTIKKTTIDASLQQNVTEIIERQMVPLRANYIYNAAAIVVNVDNGNVLAYVGNSKACDNEQRGNQVDIIDSKRSTGSILKPFLYAAALDAGEILPSTLLPDVPAIFSGYAPKNSSNTYDGAVNAQKALARSLNIPAVFLLKDYGVQRFYELLKKIGITTLNRTSDNYGLSLILGGAEAKLWDICSIYTGMVRSLKYFPSRSDMYSQNDYNQLHYFADVALVPPSDLKATGNIGAGAIWHTFNAMLEVNKPANESGWENYLSTWKVAWKTGTSFGFRDAWAVGLNSHYVVGVWVGNADGTGRPGLTGVDCAAPVMFEIFRSLDKYGWFSVPADDLVKMSVCAMSGHLASDICPVVDSVLIPAKGVNSSVCPYHKLIYTDKINHFRVNSECESIYNMNKITWFVLPPVMETYYKHKNPSYKTLPPFRKDCALANSQSIDFVYPNEGAKVFIPVNIKQEKEKVVFKVVHNNPNSHVFWHLDGFYVGKTCGVHEMALCPSAGYHELLVIDDCGEALKRHFTVLAK
jgi:penicillin-binding protein 1C